MTVHTIPPGVPFARALAARLWAETRADSPTPERGGSGGGPEALGRTSVLLPTRRAARGLQEIFVQLSGGAPCLLPAMIALADLENAAPALGAAAPDLPPAMPALRRQMLLTRLVMRQGRPLPVAMPAARALGRLLDEMERQEVGWDRLDAIVPEHFSDQWRVTIDFLAILREAWPAILAEEGALDPLARQRMVSDALAQRWAERPPPGPVIAAGSTGSVPATARLLATIAAMPQGRVVLPGLDPDMDEADWAALDPAHPAWGLQQILAAMGVDRGAVQQWPSSETSPDPSPRRALAREIMRPAATLDAWRALRAETVAPALEGARLHVCADPGQEAARIAILLREALETPGRTAMLVTPDRALARRVAATMRRWGVAIDDSAGMPLSRTRAGAFLSLIAAPASRAGTLALLRHPLCVLEGARAHATALELHWRGATDAAPEPLEALDAALAPLHDAHEAPLAEWIAAHLAAAQALADREALWSGTDGRAAAQLTADLQGAADIAPTMTGPDYAALLADALGGVDVRPPEALYHPRLQILGPLEARLMDADLVVLGALNEGSWPRDPGHDPWLSRPMREAVGLPPADAIVGQSAHDFVQGLCAQSVVLTRAERVDGVPTVPARWLVRLQAALGAAQVDPATLDDPERAAWAAALDRPAQVAPAPRPAPRPPAKARPRRMSVTQVEAWLKNPYAVYARHVLRLKPLEALEPEADARLFGSALHDALERFIKAGAITESAFLDAADRALGEVSAPVFWRARMQHMAPQIVAQEQAWRAGGAAPWLQEENGSTELEAPGGPFVLHGRADRIDRLPGGGAAVIDYKSGGQFAKKALAAGALPQLPLEALMLRDGGFAGARGEARALAYWAVRPGGVKVTQVEGQAACGAVDAAAGGLAGWVAAFDDPAMPYLARPRPEHAPDYDDYAQLARTDEWS